MSEAPAGSGHDLDAVEFAPWPVFAEDEIEAASRVLRSGRVSCWTGAEVKAFEDELAAYLGAPHALAVANGTVALELALRVLGIGPGDEVVVPSRTFIATASAVVMCGATPIVADLDPVSQNITADSIEAVMTPKTRAVVVVHLVGWPCDMDAIMALARKRGIKVIEDCAQALGGVYRGRRLGTIGDVGAFSFCQDKILTTAGEGGLLATADRTLWERAWSFKDHGKSHRLVRQPHDSHGFRWLHETFGTNGRLTEVQAAVGRSQLEKLDGWLTRRRANAGRLDRAFAAIAGMQVTRPDDGFEHAYYKYYALIRTEQLRAGWTRDRIMESVVARGVPCFTGVCAEIYREEAFRRVGLGPAERLPVASDLEARALMFLVHPTLCAAHMHRAARVVEQVMSEAVAGP